MFSILTLETKMANTVNVIPVSVTNILVHVTATAYGFIPHRPKLRCNTTEIIFDVLTQSKPIQRLYYIWKNSRVH